MRGEAAPADATSVQPRPKTGLLSGWKADNAGLSLSSCDAPTARMGVAPVVTRERTTDPNHRPTPMQGFVPGQVSLYESGARSFAPQWAGTPVQESPSLQLLAPFNVNAQPFPKPPAWSPGSVGYQSSTPPMAQPMGFYAAPPRPIVQTPAPQGPKKSSRRKRRFPVWARVIVSVLLVLLILGGVGLGYYQVYFANPINNIINQPAAHVGVNEDTGSHQAGKTNGPTLSGGRINILLLGSDNDTKFDAPLAQTDIVVTIDPTTKYVGMLSIPRDLWINAPGLGMMKLDEAFGNGWREVHVGPTPFSNAVGESEATVLQDFGIHINYYAWVGLNGFIKVIDTAHGVDIDAIHPMTDDNYPDDVNTKDAYGYKRLYIAPGPQHLDGIHALEYVRTRHSDLVGDFGRSQRQQQVLSQLKTKLANPGIVSQLPELIKDMNGYVKTDMNLSTIIQLMGFARNLDPNTVDRLVLSPPYSTSFTAPNGEDAFKPVCSLILPKIARMFALGDNAVCNVQADAANSSSLASSATIPSGPALAQTLGPLQALDQMAQVGTASVQQGNGDFFGVHSLLDLLFLVVFESFDAAKV